MTAFTINPSPAEVSKYQKKWKELHDYKQQEESLKILFKETYPRNSKIHDVLVKVSTLNDFYSTNIGKHSKPYYVAKHIIKLNIDDRLYTPDYSLVEEIAEVERENGKNVRLYSFATKYCSHHNSEGFPIYDRFVGEVLKHLRNRDSFSRFSNAELKDYPRFLEILEHFREGYNLKNFTLKEIDRYLWQVGKENFSRSESKEMQSNQSTVGDLVWIAVQTITEGDTYSTFKPRDVIAATEILSPGVNHGTVRASLVRECVNHNSRRHYPGRKNDRYWLIQKGVYSLFDPDRNGS